jgi:hypothetical protein
MGRLVHLQIIKTQRRDRNIEMQFGHTPSLLPAPARRPLRSPRPNSRLISCILNFHRLVLPETKPSETL